MSKNFLKNLGCLLVIAPIALYAPAKQNPKAKMAKSSAAQSGKKLKNNDADDELLESILSSNQHKQALQEVKVRESQKKESMLFEKFNKNFTDSQKNQAMILFSLMARDLSDEREYQKVFDFIIGLSDPIVINVQNPHGITALMFFSQLGKVDLVKLLLEKKADPNISSNTNWTALMYATENGHKDVVELLLQQKNININQKNVEDEATALVLAVGKHMDQIDEPYSQNTVDIVKLLLAHGADPNIADNLHVTPLIFAAQEQESFEIVKALIDYKAGINQQSDAGNTALIVATQYNHIRVVKILLSRNANSLLKNKQEATALTKAVEIKNIEIMQLILHHEAKYKDKDAVDKNKLKALYIAAKNGFEEGVLVVLQSGMPLKVLDNGQTPLFHACSFGHLGIVKMLIDHGFPINAQESENKATALMLASYYNRLDIVKALLEAGGNPFLQDRDGKTALLLAQQQGHKEVAALLSAYMLQQKNEEKTLADWYQRWHGAHQRKADEAKSALFQDSLLPAVDSQDMDDARSLAAPSPVSDWAEDWDSEAFMQRQQELAR